MNRFLKFTAFFLTVGILIGTFYGCTQDVSSRTESNSVVSNQPMEMMEFVDLEFLLGISGTEDGYYESASLSGGNYIILYTDYATKQRVPLCNRPECLHNDETCTAWVSRSVVPFVAGDKLYLKYTRMDDPSLSVEDRYQRIEQMDLNGENRKVLVRFEANKEMTGNIVSDGTYFYVIREIIESVTDASYELLRISLIDGSVEVLEKLDKKYFLLGGWGKQLLMKDIGFSELLSFSELDQLNNQTDSHRLSLYNIDSKQFQVIDQWDSSEKSVLTYQDKMYSLIYGDTPSLVETDLQTQEEKTICTEFPFQVFTSTYLSKIWDGYIIIQSFEPADNEIGQISRVFCVDCNSGSANEISNKYEVNGNKMSYVILAQTHDSFLVQSGSEEFTFMASAPDGSKYETTSIRPVHALISKEDYFNNKDAVDIITSLDDAFIY